MPDIQLREALRAAMIEAINRIEGLEVSPSEVNYLLVELRDEVLTASQMYEFLGNEGLLVRVCDSFYGMPAGRYLRIAVKSQMAKAGLIA